MGGVCTFSRRVVFADGSDIRELGGDIGAIGARPDASAIAQRGKYADRNRRLSRDYVITSYHYPTACADVDSLKMKRLGWHHPTWRGLKMSDSPADKPVTKSLPGSGATG